MSVRTLIYHLNHLSLKLSNMSDKELVDDYKTFRMEKEKVTERQVNLELGVFLNIRKNHNSYLEYITERIDKTFLEMITTRSEYFKMKHELYRLYLQYQNSYRNYYSSKNLQTLYSIINELESALNKNIINDDGTPGINDYGTPGINDLQKLITEQDEVLDNINQKEIKKIELIDDLIAELKPKFEKIESQLQEWKLETYGGSYRALINFKRKNPSGYYNDKKAIDEWIDEIESEKSELLIAERHKRMTRQLDIILTKEKYSDVSRSINNQKSPPDDIITLLESLKKDILEKSNKLSGVSSGGYKRQSSVKKYKKRRRNRVHTKHKHKKRRYFTYKK